MKLSEIEGIGNQYAAKLAKAGVRSTEALLKKGATPDGRKELAANSGISPTLILEWVNLADLFRIKGVGSEYSDLLEEAGVVGPAEGGGSRQVFRPDAQPGSDDPPDELRF